ncbi:hypothetical protein Z948_509 [Sulfitobacter donghicola DSW-25 = KCTC 12864 = JCM 14565]|nr:hypothetical protein Z948_509 [Sulfitobacter donghicola DSW-25 = KCTC 12864 = JCM 14565]
MHYTSRGKMAFEASRPRFTWPALTIAPYFKNRCKLMLVNARGAG